MAGLALPSRRVEAWKYSDLARALPGVSLPANADAARVIDALAGGVETLTVSAGESAMVVERFDASGLQARALAAHVQSGATLTRVVVQTESDGVPLGAARVTLESGASFRQFIYAEGARLARFETEVTVGGEKCRVELDGVYLVNGGRHADLTSQVLHAVPGGETRQLVKGAVRHGGRGVFQGKILVAGGAQKTDARQNHHALLLEDGAEVFAKPELEIHADDVQCAHGNTVGGLDAEALFYIRQRGIPESAARALLVEAFLTEAVSAYLPETLSAEVVARIRAWLGAAT